MHAGVVLLLAAVVSRVVPASVASVLCAVGEEDPNAVLSPAVVSRDARGSVALLPAVADTREGRASAAFLLSVVLHAGVDLDVVLDRDAAVVSREARASSVLFPAAGDTRDAHASAAFALSEALAAVVDPDVVPEAVVVSRAAPASAVCERFAAGVSTGVPVVAAYVAGVHVREALVCRRPASRAGRVAPLFRFRCHRWSRRYLESPHRGRGARGCRSGRGRRSRRAAEFCRRRATAAGTLPGTGFVTTSRKLAASIAGSGRADVAILARVAGPDCGACVGGRRQRSFL